MKVASAFVSATLLLAGYATAETQAPPDADLLAGIRLVEDGSYDKAVVTLEALAQRLSGDVHRVKELERTHVYLAVAHVALGRRDQAKAEFRSAITSMVVKPDGKRGRIRELSLAPFGFSPKVTGVFEEAKREAMAETGEKEGRFPLLLAAVGAAGGAAVVIVAAKGGDTGGQALAPAENNLAFVGSNPPPGSTIKVVRGRALLTITATVQYAVSGAYQVGASVEPSGRGWCASAWTSAVQLTAGRPVVVDVPLTFTDPGGSDSVCDTLPLTTTELLLALIPAGARAGNQSALMAPPPVAVIYTFVE